MRSTPEELLHEIRLGEDSFLELKEMVFAGKKIRGPKGDDLADGLAAFANGRGGVLIIVGRFAEFPAIVSTKSSRMFETLFSTWCSRLSMP